MSENNLPATIQEQIQAMAEANQQNVTNTGGNKIKIKRGAFNFADGSKVEEEMIAVIIAHAAKNVYFEHGYDPDSMEPPLCYAVGENANDMKPSASAPEPQAANCQECPHNKWGSGIGNAKACSNRRLLALLPEDAAGADDDLHLLDLAPTSIKSFDGYVSSLAARKTIPVTVATKLKIDDSVDYAKCDFKADHANANMEAHFARLEEAKNLVLREPKYEQGSGDEAPTKSIKKKRAPRRRAAA